MCCNLFQQYINKWMLEIIMAHFEAEIDILKCKICIRYTFFTTFSEITEKVGPDHVLFYSWFSFIYHKDLLREVLEKWNHF